MDGFWSGTGAIPRGWEVGKPRGSWGAVKRALGSESCRVGIESWFNHLLILGPGARNCTSLKELPENYKNIVSLKGDWGRG